MLDMKEKFLYFEDMYIDLQFRWRDDGTAVVSENVQSFLVMLQLGLCRWFRLGSCSNDRLSQALPHVVCVLNLCSGCTLEKVWLPSTQFNMLFFLDNLLLTNWAYNQKECHEHWASSRRRHAVCCMWNSAETLWSPVWLVCVYVCVISWGVWSRQDYKWEGWDEGGGLMFFTSYLFTWRKNVFT